MESNRSRRQALSVFDVNKSNVSSSTESISPEFHIYVAHNKVQQALLPPLNIMRALFRLLFEAFNLLFFDFFFLSSFLFLASEVLDFEPMW